MTPAVLFVDDEPDVLAALRSSLRRLRKTYRFHFAVGAEEAMALMEREAIDLVVTDMRMPGVNGVELLQRLQADHPHTIRYVLSGEAEQDLVMRALPIAHRWLTKPCERDVLVDALADAVDHRDLLGDREIRKAVAGAGGLPTPTRLYAEVLQLLADDEVSIERVAQLIATDPAIAAKLLQWANSAFSGGHSVTDLRTAIVRIGLAAVSQMVLLADVFSVTQPADRIAGFNAEALRHHVSEVSMLAAGLAIPEAAATAQMAGLFSSIGLLLEARHLPERLSRAYEEALRSDIPLLEAEGRLHGVTHPELGGHLLSVWGLPSELVLATTRAHHWPSPTADPPFGAVEAVQVARLVAQRRLESDGAVAQVGSPHLDRPSIEMEVAITRWATALTESPEAMSVKP